MKIEETCGCGASVVVHDTLLLSAARQLIEGFRVEHRACRDEVDERPTFPPQDAWAEGLRSC